MPKNGFSGVFPAFSAGKKCFSNVGLRHILGIAISHQYAKFHEKIKSTAREIQEKPFFRRKSAVPASKISCIDNGTMLDGGHCYQ